jgi:cyclohexyl-isocyanide hydratase
MQVVMLAFPRFTQLDLTGPYEVFARFPELQVHLVWKCADPVVDNNGLKIVPTGTLAECPQADILFVPGGPGQIDLMEDREVLDFLRRQAERAAYVTSVCTGSLVLAAAGLLTGYRATCHWLSLDQLALFGALPVAERVVFDRNRVTGAGVTSGIDFALALVVHLFGEERAQKVALSMEYDPKPPFAGAPWRIRNPRSLPASAPRRPAFRPSVRRSPGARRRLCRPRRGSRTTPFGAREPRPSLACLSAVSSRRLGVSRNAGQGAAR